MRRCAPGGWRASTWLVVTIGAVLIPAVGVHPASAQAVDAATLTPATAPERTGYRETTRFDDVVAFMEVVSEASPVIHLTDFGYSFEGRRLPLAVVGRLEDGEPETVRASGKVAVYLQGNIHAGEVEGKEVLLMLLREISEGRHEALLDSLVLLVAPILNADGNEQVALDNRATQHGPIGGVGTRANAQGLNINRDHTKLDSPEARSFARLLTEYDPLVAADLHTTNGTHHGYHLTYSPPLHPNTHPAIAGVARDRLFSEMSGSARDSLGWEFYFYGNAQGEGEERGWYTFDHRPRFNNNYLGLRNRIGVLSEAYSYATFEDRITATRHFVDETLRFAFENATEIRELTTAADAESIVGTPMAVRAAPERSAARVPIVMGGVVEEVNPYSGRTMLRRTEETRTEPMWEYGGFTAAETEVVPRSYLVPEGLSDVLRTLEAHGVTVGSPARVQVEDGAVLERFRLELVESGARIFEGRVEQDLTGVWESADEGSLAGQMVEVLVDQPLSRLVFYLLEPRSDDGFADWGFLADELDGASFYPILRIR